MAARVVEGFEINGSETALVEVYEAVEFDDGAAFGDGYRGGRCLLSETGARASKFTAQLGAYYTHTIHGFRVCAVAPKDGVRLWTLWRDFDGETKVWLQVRRPAPASADYVLELRNGDAEPLAKTPLIKGEPWAWACIEIGVVTGKPDSAPVGSFELRVDMVTVATASAVNTSFEGTAPGNRFEIQAFADEDWAGAEPSFVAVDDVYAVDVPLSPGTGVEDFMGAPVMREVAVADVGAAADWTPTGAADAALAVDDPDPDHDGDATYVEAPDDSSDALFTLSPITSEVGDVVHAVKQQTVARLDAVGSENMRQFLALPDATDTSPAYAVDSTGYKRKERVIDTDAGVGGRILLERLQDSETGFGSL